MALGVEKLFKRGKTLETGTPIYGRQIAHLPRYGFAPQMSFSVDKPVDGLPRICPQGESALSNSDSPTSGRESQESDQIYGF